MASFLVARFSLQNYLVSFAQLPLKVYLDSGTDGGEEPQDVVSTWLNSK
jgi:hypothetical protein